MPVFYEKNFIIRYFCQASEEKKEFFSASGKNVSFLTVALFLTFISDILLSTRDELQQEPLLSIHRPVNKLLSPAAN